MMVEVAHHPRGFTLFERPSGNGWRNFKLVANQRRKKRNWWLGWNGERLSEGKDMKLLQEHEPEICEWVVDVLGVSPSTANQSHPSAVYTAHTHNP